MFHYTILDSYIYVLLIFEQFSTDLVVNNTGKSLLEAFTVRAPS